MISDELQHCELLSSLQISKYDETIGTCHGELSQAAETTVYVRHRATSVCNGQQVGACERACYVRAIWSQCLMQEIEKELPPPPYHQLFVSLRV